MRLSYLALDSCCSWIVNECGKWSSNCLAHHTKTDRCVSPADPPPSEGLGFDDCDLIASLLHRHFRSRLPASVVNDIWLHLLHDFCPLIADRTHALHVKRIFQPAQRQRQSLSFGGEQLSASRDATEVRTCDASYEPTHACPLILSRFFIAGDEDTEVPPSLQGVRHLELVRGVWELQGGQLSPVCGDLRYLQENPIFQDLNEKDSVSSSTSSSSSSDDSESTDSSEDDDSHVGDAQFNLSKRYDIHNSAEKWSTPFPPCLSTLHISAGFVSSFPSMIYKCMRCSPSLAILCLSDMELRVWFFEALLNWKETMTELHLFRCPLIAESLSAAHEGVQNIVHLTGLQALSLVSCEWANAVFRLHFPQLSSLDVSLDLVSKLSQIRSRNRGEPPAAAAVIADAAAGADEVGGRGEGIEGAGDGGGADQDNEAAPRTADEIVDRRALFGFVERNQNLRYIGLVNHPFSQLEEVKNGRYGSRDLAVGGASSAEQMLAALQHYSGNHYLGIWGAKLRQHVLKYTLTDCFTLTSQMRLLKNVWSFADRDLLLFSLGDRFRRLNVTDEKRTKIVSRILQHAFAQMKIKPLGCGHNIVQLIHNCRTFIFAPNCLSEFLLIEMWATLFEDYVRGNTSLTMNSSRSAGCTVDANPNKVHLFVEFVKKSTLVISEDADKSKSLLSSLNSAYASIKNYLLPSTLGKKQNAPIFVHSPQRHYECLLLLWMLASSDAFATQFLMDFPLFLPSLRGYVYANREFLQCLDILETSSNLSLPDGDALIPIWGLLLHLLIKVPSSPFIFTVVDSLLQRCWALLQLPEISALLSLLSIGIITFAEPNRLHDNWQIARPFFDLHPNINDFLDHSLHMWSIQRGTLTSGKHIAFGFSIGDSLKDYLGQPFDDPDVTSSRFLRSRFVELAIKVFHPTFSLFSVAKVSERFL